MCHKLFFLQPKYIGNLLKAAESRKKEDERRNERKVQKEREAEREAAAVAEGRGRPNVGAPRPENKSCAICAGSAPLASMLAAIHIKKVSQNNQFRCHERVEDPCPMIHNTYRDIPAKD